MGKRTTGKSEIMGYSCGKTEHTTIYCKTHANDILKGKLKESTIVAIVEDPLNTNGGDDFTRELSLFAF